MSSLGGLVTLVWIVTRGTAMLCGAADAAGALVADVLIAPMTKRASTIFVELFLAMLRVRVHRVEDGAASRLWVFRAFAIPFGLGLTPSTCLGAEGLLPQHAWPLG